MKMVVKFLLYALVIVLLVSWMTTVIRSCGEEDLQQTTQIGDPGMDGTQTEFDDELADEMIASGNNEQANPGKDGDVSPQITSIDYSKTLDKDEEAILEKLAREKEIEDRAKATEASETKPASKPAKNTQSTQTKTPTSASGKYFVITGSFGVKDNADTQRDKLKKLGFSTAEVVQFDGSTYFSVISGRYATSADAEKAAAQLKNSHKIDCYVKKREN
jgi:cell division protein FtsN